MAILLSIGGISGAMAQSPTPEATITAGPIVLGGRIEVPSAGFAVTLPESWYAFDLSAPDLIAKMELFDATTPVAVPMVQHFVSANLRPNVPADMLLLALGPTSWESCNIVVEPTNVASLDLVMAAAGLVPTFVDLPAGRTGRADYTSPRPDGADVEVTRFVWLRNGVVYALTCGDVARPDGDWVSIAESFEFLPVEE
jgi:hypothetical protein